MQAGLSDAHAAAGSAGAVVQVGEVRFAGNLVAMVAGTARRFARIAAIHALFDDPVDAALAAVRHVAVVAARRIQRQIVDAVMPVAVEPYSQRIAGAGAVVFHGAEPVTRFAEIAELHGAS